MERAPATAADLEAVAAIVVAAETDAYGLSTYSAADLEEEWGELDLARDAFVVRDAGRVVGYGAIRERGERWRVEGYVDPAERGRGIGTRIAGWLEEAAVAGGARRIQNSILEADATAGPVLEALGYEAVRVFRELRVELDAQPAAPDWPAGLAVAPIDLERDGAAFHAAHQEAFADHWDHAPLDLAAWSRRFVDNERFDPALWCAVRDGDEIAAGTISTADTYGGGWIHVVFTRAPWRRRGLGAALLQDAFGRLWERGERSVGLGVDAASATGAFRLYERAGMRPVLGWATYEKTPAQ